MTTAEIFTPMLLNSLFAVVGCFATIGAMAVKQLTIIDADNPNSGFQAPISKVGRQQYFSLFALPPAVAGAIWGLFNAGVFPGMNEALSYAIAMSLGVVANSAILKLNGLRLKDLIELVKRNFSW